MKGQKIRILELRSTYHYGGGPDKTILLSARLHDRNRFEVLPVYLRGARDSRFSIKGRVEAEGLDVEEIPERFRVDPAALLSLARIMKERRAHILHTHDYKSDTIGYLLSLPFPGVRLLATAHGWTEGTGRLKLYNRLDLHVLKRFHRVIAVSRRTAELLRRAGVRPERVAVLPNGIDVEYWKDRGGGKRFKMGFFGHDFYPLVGTVGRLSPEKDLHTFVQACLLILGRYPEARFLIAGDGPSRGEVERRIASTPCPERFLLAGYLKDPRECYSAIDLFLVTSTSEGMPNSLLEAMAMERPVVATSVGGIPEVIEDGISGLLVPPGDPGAVFSSADRLIREREEAADLGRRARERVESAFSFDARIRGMERIYRDLVRE